MNFIWLILPALAVEPVMEPVESGQIDWTNMRLEITARSDRTVGAWKNVRVQEQDALDRLKPLIDDAARRVRFDPQRRADDLLSTDGDGVHADIVRRLDDGLGSWRVRETRYLSNGGVEMDGVLEIHRWLRPMLLSLSTSSERTAIKDGPTGVLIDARHLDFRPCLAPEVRTTDDSLLIHTSKVHTDILRRKSPVVYVRDPADPVAATRAGQHPLFLTAESSRRDCLLYVSPADSQLLINSAGFSDAVAAAKVVIVVTP
jgi:hypothetical protein